MSTLEWMPNREPVSRRLLWKMAVIFLCAGLNFAQSANSQETTPVLVWERTYNDYESFDQMLLVGEEEVVVVTDEYTGGETRRDVYLIKLDAAGEILWERTFGGDSTDTANSLARTRDGGFLFCGATRSFPQDDQSSNDLYLVKTDSEGILQWERNYGGTEDEWGWYAQEREEGGYFLFGGLEGNETGELYVALTNESGVVQTENYFASERPLSDIAYEARHTFARGRPTADGGSIVHTYGELFRLSSQGSVMWEIDYAPLGQSPRINDAIQTSDGGFVIGIDKLGNPDETLLKELDQDGNEQWSVNLSEDIGPYAVGALDETTDQGIIVGGSDGRREDGTRTVAKTDEDGIIQWNLFIPGSETGNTHIEIRSVIEQSSNRFIVAGLLYRPSHPPPPTLKAYLGRIEVATESSTDPRTLDLP